MVIHSCIGCFLVLAIGFTHGVMACVLSVSLVAGTDPFARRFDMFEFVICYVF
jgi:hypothetical protein